MIHGRELNVKNRGWCEYLHLTMWGCSFFFARRLVRLVTLHYWTSQCVDFFIYGEFGISLLYIYIYRKIETDLLHSSASNNETKKQGSVGSTMYKANLQRCRSVTLCISRFSPRALPRLSLCFFYFMYTMHSFFELYGFCGFSISLPLTLVHHSHSVSSFFFFFSFLFPVFLFLHN